MTRRRVEERPGGAAGFFAETRDELRCGTYRPEPVRQRLIPKPGKAGKVRPLGIPTLKDRLVQMALKLILEPIFEADFHPTSYGFRQGRSTHDALAKIQRSLHPTQHEPSVYAHVIGGDIEDCFDALDHHVLMDRVRRRVGDRKVLRLILGFLKAGVMVKGTVRHPVTGSPQGGIILPLLSNIYLTALDKRYSRWPPRPREHPQIAADRRFYDRRRGRPAFFMVRYADDFVVLVAGTREQAKTEKHALASFLKEELRMDLSMEKIRITAAQTKPLQSGRRVGNLFIPKGKLNDLRYRIKALVRATPTGDSLASLIDRLNPILTGWRTYYLYATWACRDFNKLDNWIWWRLGRWLRKKHRKAYWRQLRRRFTRNVRGERQRWIDGPSRLRFLREGGTSHFPHRGMQIPNGWNAEPEKRFRPGARDFWQAFNLLSTL